MRKLLISLLVLISSTSLFAIDWNFKDGVLTLTGEGEIPGSGYNQFDTTAKNPKPWWSEWAFLEGITKVIIGEGITSIGDGNFAHCINLETVELPSTLTRIDNYAFRMCIRLKNIVIPSSVKYIGYGVFYNSPIEKIIIPVGTKIQDTTFDKSKTQVLYLHEPCSGSF